MFSGFVARPADWRSGILMLVIVTGAVFHESLKETTTHSLDRCREGILPIAVKGMSSGWESFRRIAARIRVKPVAIFGFSLE